MIIHKSIDLEPLFPTEVHLIIGDTWGQIDDYLLETSFSVNLTYDDVYTAVTQNNLGVIGIFMPRNKFNSSLGKDPLTILVHESVHAAHAVIHHIGAEISYNNQELVAYITDYIFRVFKDTILEEIEKKKDGK